MKVLLVIDMLKDFLDKDGLLYCGDNARKIIPFVKEKVGKYLKENNKIIFINDSHDDNDLEFKLFPKHCVTGTKGADLIDELQKFNENCEFIGKMRYSGFYSTPLEKLLNAHKPEVVEVVGVCTSICVMDTVGGLRNRDYDVVVYKEGVADFDPEAHEFALKRMEKIYGAKIV